MAVVPAARTTLQRVVLADRYCRIVQRDPHRDHVRVLPAHPQPERDLLHRLDRVALRLLRLAGDPAQVPRLVRQRDDAPYRPLRVLVAGAADEASERLLVPPPTCSRPRQVEAERFVLVSRLAVLIEVDPQPEFGGAARSPPAAREARTADLDVPRRDRARDQGETVLVLLLAA